MAGVAPSRGPKRFLQKAPADSKARGSFHHSPECSPAPEPATPASFCLSRASFAASGLVACRHSLELLVHPAFEGIESLWSAEEALHQVISRHRAGLLQHRRAIAQCHLRSEEIIAVELAEEVLGDHLVPQVRVVSRRVTGQVSERGNLVVAFEWLERSEALR